MKRDRAGTSNRGRRTNLQRVANGAVLCALSLAGCGGGSTTSVVVNPNPTPTPVPTATPRPTPTPGPTATPVPPPPIVFDLRGRTRVNGVLTAGVTVNAVGAAGATTASATTVSGAGGVYSFFLGQGSYNLTATFNNRSVQRSVTIPAGGQAVDNFDLSL